MTKSSQELVRRALRAADTYRSRRERAALRCALSDAAHYCDAVAREIEEANTYRGRVTNVAQHTAHIIKACADEIWAMRDLIAVPEGED